MKSKMVCFIYICFVGILCISGSSYAVSMAKLDKEVIQNSLETPLLEEPAA